MKSKHAQTEIIGLVVIVIIVSIAMLFYLSYATNQGESSTQDNTYKEYIYNELSVSFVQTLLKTTIENCGDVSFEDLVYDCGTKHQIVCDNGLNSCDQASKTARSIINDTLDVWDFPYNFEIIYSSVRQETIIKYNCTADTVGHAAPGIFLVPYFPHPGNARIGLGICG